MQITDQTTNSKTWLLVVLGALVILTAISAVGIFLVTSARNRSEQASSNAVLATIAGDYGEVRNMIASSFQEEGGETTQDALPSERTETMEINIKSIAQAISSFLEIGKQKDIDEAARRNDEDLRMIKEAQGAVKELRDALDSATIQGEEAQELLSAIDHFYASLDVFLEQLNVYKTYNGEILSAIPITDIITGSTMLQESIEQLHQLPEFPEEKHLHDIYESYVSAFRILKTANDEAARNLRMVTAPEQSVIQAELQEMLKLNIALFELSSFQQNLVIQRAEQYGVDLLTTQFDYDQTDLENTSDQLKRLLAQIRHDSELSSLFESVLSADREVREALARTDIPLSIDDQDLEVLIREYERPEITRRADELEEAINRLDGKEILIREEAAEESLPFHIKRGTISFTITTSFSQGPEYEIDVISPNGRRFPARDIADYVSDTPDVSIYRFDDPTPGEWKIVPKGEPGTQFDIRVFAHPTELY